MALIGFDGYTTGRLLQQILSVKGSEDLMTRANSRRKTRGGRMAGRERRRPRRSQRPRGEETPKTRAPPTLKMRR